MYLNQVSARASKAIVEKIRGGFYSQFVTDCESVCGPYSKLIRRRVLTKSDWTICIEFFNEYGRKAATDDFYPLPIRWYFDTDYYVTLDPSAKSRMILDAVQEVCLWAAERMDWDTRPFEDAYSQMLANDCGWTFESKPIRIPGKRGRIQFEMRIRLGQIGFSANLLASRSRKILSQFDMGTIPPHSSYFYGMFPEVVWLTDDSFTIGRQVYHVVEDEVGGGLYIEKTAAHQ